MSRPVPPLILASQSRYRHALLERLQRPFSVVVPAVDETPLADEEPVALAKRLAMTKAQAVAALHPGALVIGSDQTASVAGLRLEKPGTHEAAFKQLQVQSGRRVLFHTALALCYGGESRLACVDSTVTFRHLSADEIARYLALEQPYDCAGSFRCEGLGISLFESLDSCDPTALVGLPLIALARLYRSFGFTLP